MGADLCHRCGDVVATVFSEVGSWCAACDTALDEIDETVRSSIAPLEKRVKALERQVQELVKARHSCGESGHLDCRVTDVRMEEGLLKVKTTHSKGSSPQEAGDPSESAE